MKLKSNPFLRSACLAASIVLSLSQAASAADYYWDVNGATAGTGGAGNWSTASTWRDSSAIGNLGNWVDGNTAILGGTAGAVTITSGVTITTPKISVTTANYSLSGGTVAFGGTASSPGIIDVNATSGFTFSSNATGSLKVQATGNTATVANAAPLTISGSTNLTSFELALATDSNHIILGNAAALGTASSTVKLTKGVLNLGLTSGSSNFSYNAWATDLAGGTIRGRFDTSTWNGASSLSANTQFMTRNAASVKLVFSSTGTVNLNDKTLTLMASSLSSGIELNGIISGTGNIVTGGAALGGTDNALGTSTLGAANTFSGTATTTQNLGTLALNNVDALKNATLDTGLSGTQAVTFVVAGTNTYNIGALQGSDALAIGANTISLGNKAGSSSFGADISGAGGLTKTGSGSTQILTATTSYIGATSITGGTLSLTGSGAINSSSGISVNGSGAKLLHTGSTAISSAVALTNGTLTGSGTVNTVNVGAGTGGIISNNNGVAGAALTVGTLTLSGGASINLYSNSTAAALNVTTLTNNSSANAVTITANNVGGWTNGSTYNLIGYTTLNGTGLNNFAHVVNNLSARQTPTWGDTGSAIQITVNGDNPRWMGDGDGKWNLASSSNWKLVTGGGYTSYLATDDVLFDNNATGVTSIDIDAANVAPTTTVFSNTTAKTYTLGSTGGFGISTGNLTKNNDGSVTISTNNTYTGPTTLNAGTVTLSGSGTLGSGSALTMNGAQLDLGTGSRTVGAVSITAPAASGDTLLNGSLTGTSYAVSNTSGNVGISANLLVNGAAGFTKSGAGTSTLSGANTYTGPTAINAGSLVLSGSGTLGNGAALTLGGGSLDLGTLSRSVGAVSVTAPAASGDTISNGSLTGTSYAASNTSGNAIISANLLVNGAAGFAMSGAGGTATLSGANTYTGTTSISAGTLKSGSASAFNNTSALSMSGSGTLDLSGYSASFTNILASAGTNTITTSGSGTGPDTLTISGLTTTTGALFTDGATRKLAISINGTATLDPLSNGSNTFSGGLSLLNMRLGVVDNSATTGGRYGKGAITIGTGSQLYFNAANKTISNDIIVNANSSVGSRTGAFRVDTAGHTLSGTITAGAADAMFNPGGGVGGLTITGKITGSNGLQVRNTNGTSMTLTLNNASANNDYLGLTSVGETTAKLVLGAADQIPNGAGKGNVSLTGTLDLAGFSETINGLSGAGILEGATAGTPSNTLTIGDGDATGLTFSGVIQNTAGSLALTKTGSGIQTLSGTNTYTGATLISGGTLQIGNGGATGVLSATSTITNHGTLAFNRTGTVTQGTDFAAGITGNGSLSTSGSGTVILSGTNGYLGTTSISSGELRLTSATAINGTSGITVSSGRLSLDGGIATGSGKSVTVNGNGANFFGALQGNSGANEWLGGVLVGSTAGTRIGVNVGSLKVSGAISGSTALNGLMLRPNNGTTLELSGANTYLGDTTIVSGTGEVKLSGGADRLPTGSKLIFGASAVSGILNLNGQNQEVAGLSVVSGTTNEIKSATAATLTVNTASASPSSYSGIITGSTALAKTGSDTLNLSGANTYTGGTSIKNGSLILSGGNDRLATTGSVALGDVATSGKLILGDATTARNQTLAGLTSTGLGGNVVGAHATTDSLLTLNIASGTNTFGGVLGGGGTNENKLALTKSGNGTLEFTNTSSYTGATTVSAGTLIIDGNISTSSLTTVNGTGILGGSGTVGDLTIAATGTHNPGNSPGIMNTGDYTMAGTLNIEAIGNTPGVGGYDQVNVTGTVNLSGTLATAFTGGTYANGNLLFILLNDSNDAISGTFAGLAQGALVTSYGGYDWNISYTADSTGNTFTGGNDVALMAIPEPNVAALLGGLGTLLLLRRRRSA